MFTKRSKLCTIIIPYQRKEMKESDCIALIEKNYGSKSLVTY